MIRVWWDGRELRVRGHAGYAPAGQDIVCAAASILTDTLASLLPSEQVKLEPGSVRITCRREEAAFALQGLRLLEKAYPECIHIHEKVEQFFQDKP